MAGEQSQQGFAMMMRGYDKAQVDERIHTLESALRDARVGMEEVDARASKLAAEVAEANRQLHQAERPSYQGLGSRIDQLLRLAEEQAGDVIGAASQDADGIRGKAASDVEQVRKDTTKEVADLLAVAGREVADLRRNATSEVDEIVSTATRKADEMLAIAEREADRKSVV